MSSYEQRRERLREAQAEARARRTSGQPAASRRGKRPLSERLISSVAARGDCLEWTGSLDRYGYGKIGLQGRVEKAHRLSWLLHRGVIPDGLVVRHDCDNPRCVRIDHLRLGTQADNVADRERRGRGATRRHIGATEAK